MGVGHNINHENYFHAGRNKTESSDHKEAKHLGVMITKDFKREHHCEEITLEAMKVLGVVR